MVNTQCSQACIHSFAQPLRACVANDAGINLAQAAFGGDDELVAVTDELLAQRSTEDALGCTEAVRLGCVEEVDTQFAGAANRRDGCGLVELAPVAPELPSAECDSRYF